MAIVCSASPILKVLRSVRLTRRRKRRFSEADQTRHIKPNAMTKPRPEKKTPPKLPHYSSELTQLPLSRSFFLCLPPHYRQSATMLQSTTRRATRQLLSSRLPPSIHNVTSGPSSRRFLSSAPSPASKSRSWKAGALRWGLAAAGVYYYNTSSIFAEETDGMTFNQILSVSPRTYNGPY